MEVTMDPLFIAWSYFRRRKLQQCSDICSKILEENPYDQAAWGLKTCALTEMVYIDEVEVDQEGIAEMMLDESSIAQVARDPNPIPIHIPNCNPGKYTKMFIFFIYVFVKVEFDAS
uniref:Tetratricopeptide repeat domain 8 n=1 Tax=Gouania willdenowi TaxID=441366 RepID=A0A8C5DI22_GOUWI